ncbi:MAG: lytic transglycosylase domain-containing protein [Candidatus Omnitrophica bacterium]|nr:lytic transglycosylase domain-containing protein [Candidatus Omnitrophota bacterium]
MLKHNRCKTAVITLLLAIIALFPFLSLRAEPSVDLEIIKIIESDGNPLAFNSGTKCYGLYQISEICLKDYNQMNTTAYLPKDLFNPRTNEKIAGWYFKRIEKMLHFYNIPVSTTTLIASYNWGIGNVIKWHRAGAKFQELPKATKKYIQTYQKLNLASVRPR